MSAKRVAIIGDGKMGRSVAQVAEANGWTIVAHLGIVGNPGGRGITRQSLAGASVAIEFTEARSVVANVDACLAARCPVVVGTTGWYDHLPAVTASVERAGGSLFWAANFSLGANIMMALAREAGRLVRALPHFDAQIVETHHTMKQDAPSGTAVVVNQAFAEGRGEPARIASLRVGSVPGTHELILDGIYEQLRIVHEARDRRIFAEGALAAATWLGGRHGIFTMRDMLALHPEAR